MIDLILESPIAMDPADPNNPMIHSHEKANPAHLHDRIARARSQLNELAEMAQSNDLIVWEKICQLAKGGMFMGLEQNLEQIRHGIQQLALQRKKGGVNSRGIDKNIGEQINESLNINAKCTRCGTEYAKHFRFDPEGDPTGKIVGTRVRGLCGQVPDNFPDLQKIDEAGKASRELCTSSRSNKELGASNLASCKSQGLRSREGDKSHLMGKGPESRMKMGGHKVKGKKYGGKIPDWS
jgi:hypothetical protein